MIRDSDQRPHQRLDVWRDAVELVTAVYRLTTGFPEAERFGLSAQMRRAAVSVPSNIAEGAARRSTSQYLHSLSIARGSLSELDTQMHIAQRLGYASPNPELQELLDRCFSRLNALVRALESSTRAVREPDPPYESRIPNPQSHAR